MVGRAVLFVHLVLSPLVFSRETIEAFEYNKVALLVAAAIVLATLVPGALVPRLSTLRDPLGLGVLLFTLSALVSTVLSISRWTSLFGANESYVGLGTVVAYAILFLATRSLVTTFADAQRLTLASVTAAAVAATYALVQVVGLDPILYARTSGLAGLVRPFATMGHPNFLSAFLVGAIPLVVYALVRALRAGQRVTAAVMGAIVIVAGAATAASVSRGAWLALAAAIIVLAAGAHAIGERRLAGAVVIVSGGAVVGLAVLAIALPSGRGFATLASLAQRVRQFGESASRQHIWQAAWDIFRDHPLVGAGLDTLQIAFADKRTVAYWNLEWNGSPTRAHNEALNILATQGLLGGLAVLVLVAGVVIATRSARRVAEDRLLVVALLAGLVAFGVQDLFSFTVAGCGTLAVTQAALLSRLAAGPSTGRSDGAVSLVTGLAIASVVAVVIFASNVPPELLLDEPRRLFGGLIILIAFLVVAVAVFVLEQHGRPPLFQGTSSGPAVARPRRTIGRTVALAARGILGAVALVLLVFRPVAAARAAQQGILLTPSEPARAVQRLERAVALDPVNELYWVKLGAAAQAYARTVREAPTRRSALQQAHAAFMRAAQLSPANSYNHANVGRVLADLAQVGDGSPGAAFAAFDRALQIDPNNAYFYADAANAAMVLGDFERAREYAERGSKLYPRFALTRALLGHIALARRQPAEAVEPLQQAVSGDWHGAERLRVAAASNLAAAYLELGRPVEAEAAARVAIERAPNFADARFNRGRALERLGRRAEAVEEYRRALTDQPDHLPARQALRALGES
ncbi:MAG TPA: O-antigen ligase family protein [Patescibacteria group bacterium]|nr:O-antigen ligase family protein [Patescibacteria group bacterium]